MGVNWLGGWLDFATCCISSISIFMYTSVNIFLLVKSHFIIWLFTSLAIFNIWKQFLILFHAYWMNINWIVSDSIFLTEHVTKIMVFLFFKWIFERLHLNKKKTPTLNFALEWYSIPYYVITNYKAINSIIFKMGQLDIFFTITYAFPSLYDKKQNIFM